MASSTYTQVIAAVLIGTAVGAILFGIAGAVSERALFGVGIGAPLGAVIGYALARRWIGTIVIWIAVFAVAGLILSGCDMEAPIAALTGAAFGGFLGFTGWWRGTLVVFATWCGGGIGPCIGAGPLTPRPEQGLLGAAIGFGLAWIIGYKLFPPKVAPEETLEAD